MATDNRIFHGANCLFWTDDFSTLGKSPGGIPLCPKCGSPGYEQTLARWWKDAENYAAGTGDRNYLRLISWMKGRCFKTFNEATTQFDSANKD
jgi:hypothetical protein